LLSLSLSLSLSPSRSLFESLDFFLPPFLPPGLSLLSSRATGAKAECNQKKCRSPDGSGGYDCWAGNGEPFACAGDYQAQKTGKTTKHFGLIWEEYTCCPSESADTTENAFAECPGFDGAKTGGYKTGLVYTNPETEKKEYQYRCCPDAGAATMDYDTCVR